MYIKNYRRSLPCLFVTAATFILFLTLISLPENYQLQNLQAKGFKESKHFCRRVYEDREFNYTKIEYVNKKIVDAESNKSLLVLSSISNKDSYGKEKTFEDLFNTIQSFEYHKNSISLGFLVGSREEFEELDKYFQNYFEQLVFLSKTRNNDILSKYVRKVTLLSAPFIEKDFNSISREDRHNDRLQKLRRRLIARSRNFVLFNSLQDEKYTLFIDADVVRIGNQDMLQEFIKSGKDIIVPRIIRGGNPDYDKNSWVGERTTPDKDNLKKMDENDWDNWDYVPRDVEGKMVHFETFLKNNQDKPETDRTKQSTYLMNLDSVGGAILFVKSIVYRQGVAFPPNYIIGTTWNRLEGYDGIETEGLCYMAKTLGYTCWGMPNMVAYHSDE